MTGLDALYLQALSSVTKIITIMWNQADTSHSNCIQPFQLLSSCNVPTHPLVVYARQRVVQSSGLSYSLPGFVTSAIPLKEEQVEIVRQKYQRGTCVYKLSAELIGNILHNTLLTGAIWDSNNNNAAIPPLFCVNSNGWGMGLEKCRHSQIQNPKTYVQINDRPFKACRYNALYLVIGLYEPL